MPAGRGRAFRSMVLLNGRLAGQLRRATSGAIDFQYAHGWLGWEHTLPVSLSLPLREDRYVGAAVVAVFDNLLPDSMRFADGSPHARARTGPTSSACSTRSDATAWARCSSSQRAKRTPRHFAQTAVSAGMGASVVDGCSTKLPGRCRAQSTRSPTACPTIFRAV